MGPNERIGTVIDRYRIERQLGAGGFGAVFLARHTVMDRQVALKVLHPEAARDAGIRERFLREAQAAAAVGHHAIVQVFDCGITSEGEPFIVMELLDGQDLEQLLAQHGALPWQDAVRLCIRVLEALDAAHAAGIVHRDLKPANVFLPRGDDRYAVKLLDFGISKVRDDGVRKLTRTGMVMGTPHYMAPETFKGAHAVDARADLYSVAAMIYELIRGCPPYDADTYEQLIVKVATTEAPRLTGVALPQLLKDVVHTGLQTDPGQRWQTARAFGAALQSALDGGVVEGTASTAASPAYPDGNLSTSPMSANSMASLAAASAGSAGVSMATGTPQPVWLAPSNPPSSQPSILTQSSQPSILSQSSQPSVLSQPTPAPSTGPMNGQSAPLPDYAMPQAPSSNPLDGLSGPLPDYAVPQAPQASPTSSGGSSAVAWIIGALAALIFIGFGLYIALDEGDEAPPAPAPAPSAPVAPTNSMQTPAVTPSETPSEPSTPIAPAPVNPAPAQAPAPNPTLGAPVNAAPSAAQNGGGRFQIIPVSTVTASGAGSYDYAERAAGMRARFMNCAADTATEVRIQVFFNQAGNEPSIVQPDPNEAHGPDDVAHCVAGVMRTVTSPPEHGIAIMRVRLPAR